jgi:hypothetical protein
MDTQLICGASSVVKDSDPEGVAIGLACKTWDCDVCGPRRRQRLVDEGIAGNPTRFITLTSKPGIHQTPDLAARALVDAWARMYRAARRRWCPGGVEFLAVFEKTKQGWPHLHILVRSAFIPQWWLSQELEKHTGAKIVDIQLIRHVKKIANYVSKYVAKDPVKFKGCKRYWRSMKYFVEELWSNPIMDSIPGKFRHVMLPIQFIEAKKQLDGTWLRTEGRAVYYASTGPP